MSRIAARCIGAKLANRGLLTDSPPVTALVVQSHRIGCIANFGFEQRRRKLELSQGRARRPAVETNVGRTQGTAVHSLCYGGTASGFGTNSVYIGSD